MYGIRKYTRGAYLLSHLDHLKTHVVSAILNVAQVSQLVSAILNVAQVSHVVSAILKVAQVSQVVSAILNVAQVSHLVSTISTTHERKWRVTTKCAFVCCHKDI